MFESRFLCIMPCICFLFGRVIGPGKRPSGPVRVTKVVKDVRRFADRKERGEGGTVERYLVSLVLMRIWVLINLIRSGVVYFWRYYSIFPR